MKRIQKISFADECNLHCRLSLDDNVYFRRGRVDDGTLCLNKNGACLNGACILLEDEPESLATTMTLVTTTTEPLQTTEAISTTTEAPTAAPASTSSVTPSESSQAPTNPAESEGTTTAHVATTIDTPTQPLSGKKNPLCRLS